MLTGLAVIFLSGLIFGWASKKLRLPALIGMIAAGIIAGPYALNIIDGAVLDISPQLRQLALVIILTRAGLSLDVNELKKAGRPALLLCFVPATLEIAATMIFAPMIFGISYIEAALVGTVIAAVSPAVVVPAMLKIMDEGYGCNKQIPQMILAGASADDVYVIVLFTAFSAILAGGEASAMDFVQIPTSIILGIALGIGVGILLNLFFTRVHIRDSVKVIIMLSLSFLMITLQDFSEDYVRVSGLIAIMALGMTVFNKNKPLAKRLSAKYNKLWTAAEIILFVLVGAAADITAIGAYGLCTVLLLVVAMLFRMAGVYVSMIKTKLSHKERLFCMLAYTPKATVQAAIGAIPLSMGLSCGGLVLSVAVLAILICAPFGAFMIELTYKRLLSKQDEKSG